MMKKTAEICILLLVSLLITGCGLRSRVMPASAPENAAGADIEGASAVPRPQDAEQAYDVAARVSPSGEPQGEPDPGAPSQNDPRADRREYDPYASAELTETADAPLMAIEQMDAGTAVGEAPDSEAVLAEMAELTATQILNQEEAQRLGVSEEAPRADTVYRFYRAMLDSRLETLFECKRFYVYFETDDYLTVHKASPEHEIIQLAGCYDVSVKRPADALRIDDGWVIRKNPGCIIKRVGGGILGEGMHRTGPARSLASRLAARPGWSGIDAVRSGRVLLLSEALTDTPAGRLSAALYIAKVLYPDIFDDLDPEEAARKLYFEQHGREADGIFAYVWEGE